MIWNLWRETISSTAADASALAFPVALLVAFASEVTLAVSVALADPGRKSEERETCTTLIGISGVGQ